MIGKNDPRWSKMIACIPGLNLSMLHSESLSTVQALMHKPTLVHNTQILSFESLDSFYLFGSFDLFELFDCKISVSAHIAVRRPAVSCAAP